MTFQVSVQSTEFRFPCEPNESVLDAAQRAGFEVPFSCRKGVCGTCKGKVISGEVRAFAGDALGASERAEGQVLFCNARPRSDLVIAPRSIGKADMIHNAGTPHIEVDAQTYEVRADGVLLTCQPATELPLAQRYFLF